MSFGSHVSAFDEALSKPLVSKSDNTNTVAASSSPKKGLWKESQSSTSSSPGRNTNAGTSIASTVAAAFSSVKLPSQQKHGNISKNPFDESYRPPNLMPEEQQQNQQHMSMSLLQGMEVKEMDEALLRERHTEALEITQDMRQIREISQDLAIIVNEQQTYIDDIEEDAHAIHDSAEKGLSHLERAANFITVSKNERFSRVLFGAIALVGLMTALIFLWGAFSS